jgi:hypothetical protein
MFRNSRGLSKDWSAVSRLYHVDLAKDDEDIIGSRLMGRWFWMCYNIIKKRKRNSGNRSSLSILR